MRGVLFKPVPFADPATLVKVDEQTKGIVDYRWGDRWAFSYPNFLDCQRDVHSLDMAAFRYGGGTVSGAGDPEFVDALQVSANLMSVLGVAPIAGRSCCPKTIGRAPRRSPSSVRRCGSAALAARRRRSVRRSRSRLRRTRSSAWRRRPSTCAGADILTPIGQNTRPFMHLRGAHPGISVWARLRPGATRAAAQAELDVVGRNLAAPLSGIEREPWLHCRATAAGRRRRAFDAVAIDGAVALVLLIACVNVASLLLARAVSQDREVAVRVALGAGRGRLVRQHLTESAVLGISGGALGVVLAAIGVQPFVRLWPGGLPGADRVQLDWGVLAFALGVSLACGFLFGLAPVLRAPSGRPDPALRAGGRSVTGSRELHSVFIVAEIALAMVLLVSAGMLGRTLLRLSSVDPGVNLENVLTSRMAVSPSILSDPARVRAAWQAVIESRPSRARRSGDCDGGPPCRCARGTTRSATGRRRPNRSGCRSRLRSPTA
jgi:hypothetical protein